MRITSHDDCKQCSGPAKPPRHRECAETAPAWVVSVLSHSPPRQGEPVDKLGQVSATYEAVLKPICLRGRVGCSFSFLSSSKTTVKYLSCVASLRMTAANFRLRSSFDC